MTRKFLPICFLFLLLFTSCEDFSEITEAEAFEQVSVKSENRLKLKELEWMDTDRAWIPAIKLFGKKSQATTIYTYTFSGIIRVIEDCNKEVMDYEGQVPNHFYTLITVPAETKASPFQHHAMDRFFTGDEFAVELELKYNKKESHSDFGHLHVKSYERIKDGAGRASFVGDTYTPRFDSDYGP